MDFYRRMEQVMQRIPYGKAATYGQLALLCGCPRNARQAGYALRRNQAGADAPAHRVVNANGILSGAGAFAFPDLQKRLLEAEGIRVEQTEKGYRVDLEKFGWKNTMEEAEALLALYRKLGI